MHMLGDTYLPSIFFLLLQSWFPQRKTIQHDGFISIFISIGDLFIPQWDRRRCDHMVSSCVYNCLCSQCLSSLTFWVRIPFMARCTYKKCPRYNIMWYSVSGRWFSPVTPISSINTTICCHNVLYFLNNLSVIFLTQLHSISEYCRILSTPHHLRLYSN
jgi:hypothetical protein